MNEDLVEYVIESTLKRGADYADVRNETHFVETVTIAKGNVTRALVCRKAGIGVRVLKDNGWGFQSTTDLTKNGVSDAIDISLSAAKASSKHITTPVKLAESLVHEDSYGVKVKVDLENVHLEDKINYAKELEKSFYVSDHITTGSLEYTGFKIDKFFANTDGSRIRFRNSMLWVNLRAQAAEGETKRSFSLRGGIGGTGGYELFRNENAVKTVKEVGVKADNLLKAKPAKEEENATVILAPSYVKIVAHEICGHASEADRVLGSEAAYTGTSWWAGQLNKKIGSESMTVYDDPTVQGSLGYYLYDDEGVRAGKKILVEKGIVKAYLQSRETAPIFGVESNASMRAISYEHIPLIRMSNTYFAPGDWTLDEMMEGIKHGYYVSTMNRPSIDSRRYNWAIGAWEAYEIKDGELSTPLFGVVLVSNASNFFLSIDAASKDYEILPYPGCGKGDPLQPGYLGNGGPYIRGIADVRGGG